MLCECGCGLTTLLATKTSSRQGRAKGQPSRFINGHSRRRSRASLYTVDLQTGCWRWNGPLSEDGYAAGTISAGARSRQAVAHRVFYERAKGPIQDGLVLDHLCRVRCCVNPDHLEAVTQKENRRRSATLTSDDVRAIRALRDSGLSQLTIARQFNVGPTCISRVLSGKRWSD